MERINGFIEFVRSKNLPVVLCFYFHPWEFMECKESYHFGECTVIPDKFITEGCGEKAAAEFSKLISMLKEIGCRFATAKELAMKWDKKYLSE